MNKFYLIKNIIHKISTHKPRINNSLHISYKQGRKRPLDTPKKMIERREREKEKERERKVEGEI